MADYYGNITLGDTIDIPLPNTLDLTGALVTLDGTPAVGAFVGNSASAITAGVTLTVDLGGVTGAHNVRVVATSGNGFTTGTNVALRLIAGTVNGVSKVGTFVGAFSIGARATASTSNIKKNQALAKFQFLMTDSTNHNPVTGKTVTCTRAIDSGTQAAGTLANVTEGANGTYLVDFGAADLNGNVILLRATASGCDDTFERIITQP